MKTKLAWCSTVPLFKNHFFGFENNHLCLWKKTEISPDPLNIILHYTRYRIYVLTTLAKYVEIMYLTFKVPATYKYIKKIEKEQHHNL